MDLDMILDGFYARVLMNRGLAGQFMRFIRFTGLGIVVDNEYPRFYSRIRIRLANTGESGRTTGSPIFVDPGCHMRIQIRRRTFASFRES